MMKLNICILMIGICFSSSEGFASIKVPSAGNCEEDTVLTCQVTFTIGSTSWYGLNKTIMANGNPQRPEDQNKYTETKGKSFFTLTIHNTDITDRGDYRCSNGFDESSLKHLNFECFASIKVPSAGNCEEDTVLTCQVTFTIGSTSWYGLNKTIMANGNPQRPEDQNKYTETKGKSFFTLTIHNTDITDGGDYRCNNGFDESSLKHLNFECKASSASYSVTRWKKVQIAVDKLYPASPTFSVTFERQYNAIQIPGLKSCSRSTQYSGYYRCVWTCSNSLDDGSYTYSIVVTTLTQASPLTGSFKIVSPGSPLISNIVPLNASRKVLYGNEGQPLTIQCTSNGGYPVPTVTWYKESISNSNPLATTSSGTFESDGTYTVILQHTFTPEASDDRKYYICRSYYPDADSAQVGSNSKSFLLYLTLQPIQPIVAQTSVVSAGNVVTVRCRTSGCRPSARISWLYRGVKYNGSTTSTLNTSTETFTVISTYTRQVTAADNGQSIQCVVTHPALASPTELTKSISLNVQFRPSTTQITGNKEIIATGFTHLTLTCTTGSSNPVSAITWKNGSDILDSDRSYTTSSGENNGAVRSQQLVLFPTRYMDGDDITCSVSNTVSQSPVVDKVKLNLQYRPMITPMSDVTVVEGNYSILVCSATSKPASTFNWYRQDQSSNVLHQGTGTLDSNKLSYRINNVRRGDAATYTCNANNGIENADNKNVLLTVYYPPDITATTRNTTVKAATAIITCNANGVPNNYRYGKWVHRWPGHSIPLSENPGSETLTLTDLTYQHSGVYTCSASNGIKVFGTDKEFMEGSVQLIVKSFPILINMTEKTSARVKENATIDVYYFSNAAGSDVKIYRNVNGSRKDEVQYIVMVTNVQVDLKVFTQMIKTGGVKAQILVKLTRKEDIGFYDVIVSNEINSTVRSFEIVAKGPPSLPFNLTVDSIKYNEARLSWRRGYHGGFPQTFVIQLSPDQRSWRDVMVFDKRNENEEMVSEVLTGLSPSTTYFVRMYAYNQEGNSAVTDSFNYTTSSKKKSSNLPRNYGAMIGGVVGGVILATAVALGIICIVVSRRTTSSHGTYRSRLLNSLSVLRKNDDSALNPYELRGNSMISMQDTYEQLHRPVTVDDKTVYDKLNAPSDCFAKSSSRNERLQKKNLPNKAELKKATVNKEGDQMYENLKIN